MRRRRGGGSGGREGSNQHIARLALVLCIRAWWKPNGGFVWSRAVATRDYPLSGSWGELPESGSEGFYFSGLGGVGVGTERQIRGNPRSNRHNGIRWGRWPDSLISGVVGEALEEGSWCLGEGGLWGPWGAPSWRQPAFQQWIVVPARFPTMDCGA